MKTQGGKNEGESFTGMPDKYGSGGNGINNSLPCPARDHNKKRHDSVFRHVLVYRNLHYMVCH